MKKSICANCKNFQPHYIYSKMFGFSKINCGHCHKKLMKKKDCRCYEKSDNNFDNEINIINYLHLYDRQIIYLSSEMGRLAGRLIELKEEIKNVSNTQQKE